MVQRRLEFDMPAPPAVVFDAFHHQIWRRRWDPLVASTQICGGADCPFVGAETVNRGAGVLSWFEMRTRFVSFDRPKVAAATMIGVSFPFVRWAASMRHRACADPGRSVMTYTVNFDTSAGVARWGLQPVVMALFVAQSRRRFARLQGFLARHAHDIVQWQAATGAEGPSASSRREPQTP